MSILKLKTKFFPQETHLYQLTKLTVISPFFGEDLFEQFIKETTDILLVTDFRSKLRADEISKSPHIKCVLSRTDKSVFIVHAKIFFFEWKYIQTGRTHSILLWGSGNATSNGFFGDNAEVHSWCDVSAYPEIIGYFRDIREKSSPAKPSGQILAVETQLQAVSLYLPPLTLMENVGDFESCLESGFLWHRLEHVSFGSLKIELSKELSDPKITKPVADNGFTVNKGKNITYHYVNKSIKQEFSPEMVGKFEYIRKTKTFSVETIYGFWASSLFYQDWQKTSDSEHEFILYRSYALTVM